MPEAVSIQGFFSGIEMRRVVDSLGSAPHMHDGYSIVLLIKGSKIVQTGSKAETASPGAVLFHEPFQVHETHSLSRTGYSFKHLGISQPRLVQLLDGDLPSERPSRINDRDLFRSLMQAYDNLITDDSMLAHDELLTGALTALLPVNESTRFRPDLTPKLVSQIRDFLHTNYMYSFTLDSLAELTQVSRVHISRVFKQHVGLAPHEYLVQLRVACAKAQLAEGMSIAETAAYSGFSDQSHLTRHFKRLTHLTPSAYAQSCYKHSRHR
jgi:AraC-like DNA-binding protein